MGQKSKKNAKNGGWGVVLSNLLHLLDQNHSSLSKLFVDLWWNFKDVDNISSISVVISTHLGQNLEHNGQQCFFSSPCNQFLPIFSIFARAFFDLHTHFFRHFSLSTCPLFFARAFFWFFCTGGKFGYTVRNYIFLTGRFFFLTGTFFLKINSS